MKKGIEMRLACLAAWLLFSLPSVAQELMPGVTKLKDVVIYSDSSRFSAFPSAVALEDGEVLVAFRSAPDRRIFGETVNYHVDPNSYLVLTRSRNGVKWSEPTLICAHPEGGSQDPCLLRLRDGKLLCSSYLWRFPRKNGFDNRSPLSFEHQGAVFGGGYLTESTDEGVHWSSPFLPPSLPEEQHRDILGKPYPCFNRGALCEGTDGRIYWAVVASNPEAPENNAVYLIASEDGGHSWERLGTIAADPRYTFNETSLYQTPKGDWVAFLRTGSMNDAACIARSNDGGKTFSWESMGFQGHPCQALGLPDGRVLLSYGYRHKPFGIRARILNAECTDWKTAPEMVLRDDAGGGDCGYPWAVSLDGIHVLVVYYIHTAADATRRIEGTLLEISPRRPVRPRIGEVRPRHAVHVRDPFIYVNEADSSYYLIASGKSNYGKSVLDAWQSHDLENWTFRGPVFEPDSLWRTFSDYWAPDTYHFRGYDYVFFTVSSKERGLLRGTTVLRSEDGVMGPYHPWVKGRINLTPEGVQSLDGSLYVDTAGKPWMLYCVEWIGPNVKNKDGEVWAVRLSMDLRRLKGKPIRLFRASDAPWMHLTNSGGGVTDAPVIHQDPESGALVMTWSSFSATGYAIGQALSESGTILGPWKQLPEPLFAGDGGHAMVFRTFDGRLMLSFHCPNSSRGGSLETLSFREVFWQDGRLTLKP